MTKLISIVLAFCFSVATGQFKVTDIKDSTEIGNYYFPLLKSQQYPEVAKKINEKLQNDELGFVITPTTKTPLAGIMNEDVYEYEIRCNNDRVISIEISTGHNGAGSHFRFRNYSFDSRTGNLINPDNLFSAAGKIKVRQQLYKAWKETIITNLKDEIFGEYYKDCLAEAAKISELDFNRMSISETELLLWGGSCLDGSSWNVDGTLGPHRLSYEQVLSSLSPYGLSIFIGNPASTSSLRQSLLKGKIDGKYSVTLTFLKSDSPGKLNGILVYDKFDSPIKIRGSLIDNQVKFNEMDDSHSPVSQIECMWDGKNLNGTFKNIKSGKVMTFTATRM